MRWVRLTKPHRVAPYTIAVEWNVLQTREEGARCKCECGGCYQYHVRRISSRGASRGNHPLILFWPLLGGRHILPEAVSSMLAAQC